MPYFLHICCMLPPPCKYSFTAASFFSAVYVFIPRCVNPATPSFSYMLIHIFTVSWSAPSSRAASLILIFCLKYSRTIFTFSSAPIFCFCGITMLPLCLTVFFPFTVSHRGSISKTAGAAVVLAAAQKASAWLRRYIRIWLRPAELSVLPLAEAYSVRREPLLSLTAEAASTR